MAMPAPAFLILPTSIFSAKRAVDGDGVWNARCESGGVLSKACRDAGCDYQ